MATEQQMASLGENRTSLEAKKKDMEQMEEAAREFPPSSQGDGVANVGRVRQAYGKETAGLGHVPPPVSKLKELKEKLQADGKAVALMDKVGARIAFERTGARLWHAVADKHDTLGSFEGGPSREDILHIQREEEQHFHMLTEVMHEIGGDPTAVTPSADVEAVTGKGVLDIVADPRTTLLQALESITVAELADHESWERLIEVAKAAGHDELVPRFEEALENERDHLRKARAWIAAGQGRA